MAIASNAPSEFDPNAVVEEQKEINEMLLHNIVTKKILKDNEKKEEVNKRASKNSGPEIENCNSSSEGTQAVGDKTVTGRKRK